MRPETQKLVTGQPSTPTEQATVLEREAHRLRGEGKIDQAFQTFDRAAHCYEEAGENLRSAVCFASAATCWNIHTGWQPLRNAATRNEFAAVQAFQAKDYAYAETLFSEAALLYEKEGDSTKYSYCYVRAKDARLLRLWRTFTQLQVTGTGAIRLEKVGLKERMASFFHWFSSSLNRAIWGYGERPFRTLGVAGGILLISAFCYYFSGSVLAEGMVRGIGFGESLYTSVITYTTVGYGDYLPLGWTRIVASMEALSGILLTPLFLIALTRRYLRMYR
ncbi:MAG TPA: ion channel [Candidatus Omnitrophota bacterium]|nr:ion channel [Candidatus Omnitrophota bacterium]HPS36933.1 ion channel [Candidatus Omnitrophota bacterium]